MPQPLTPLQKALAGAFFFFFGVGVVGSFYLFLTAPKPIDPRIAMPELVGRYPQIKSLLVQKAENEIYAQNPDESLDMGPMSGFMETLTLLQLRDAGKLSLDQPIEGFAMTVEQAMRQAFIPIDADRQANTTDHLSSLASQALRAQIQLLGAYPGLVEETVLQPLEMQHTHYLPEQQTWQTTPRDLMRLIYVLNFNTKKGIYDRKHPFHYKTLIEATSLANREKLQDWGLAVYLDDRYGLDRLSWVCVSEGRCLIVRRFPGRWFHYVIDFEGSERDAKDFARQMEDIYIGFEVPYRQRQQALNAERQP
ncbi:MAG: hypothetical protein H6510_05275 [Acidobacteria bacterium]|nr:hypothetical protein [Acidobacteriota bacterium]MCB9397206.1 hypothetical protein [Acidobacteriota bacterium]